MIVTPLPIVLLLLVVLAVVRTIFFMLLRQITAMGLVFTVIPGMVLPVVTIIDSDLDAGVLRCSGHDCYWRHKGSCQE
jgi:hypothetical protein